MLIFSLSCHPPQEDWRPSCCSFVKTNQRNQDVFLRLMRLKEKFSESKFWFNKASFSQSDNRPPAQSDPLSWKNVQCLENVYGGTLCSRPSFFLFDLTASAYLIFSLHRISLIKHFSGQFEATFAQDQERVSTKVI